MLSWHCVCVFADDQGSGKRVAIDGNRKEKDSHKQQLVSNDWVSHYSDAYFVHFVASFASPAKVLLVKYKHNSSGGGTKHRLASRRQPHNHHEFHPWKPFHAKERERRHIKRICRDKSGHYN